MPLSLEISFTKEFFTFNKYQTFFRFTNERILDWGKIKNHISLIICTDSLNSKVSYNRRHFLLQIVYEPIILKHNIF